MGSNNGQFEFPSQLTTDPIGRVFIADTYNHRICIYDANLNCSVFVNHMKRIRNTNDRLVDVIVFYQKKI